eukprot:GHVN01016990.1.p1 GENE.GHVN01016990.1~~GHVN01016990.1.p1  ORF type:complete len:456 (-),score=41.76 GHVN01016990.1:344-1711(-)
MSNQQAPGFLHRTPTTNVPASASTIQEAIARRRDRTRQFRDLLSDVEQRAAPSEQLAPKGQARLVLYYCTSHYDTFVALSNLAKRILALPPHMRVNVAYSAFMTPVNAIPQHIVETALLDPLPPDVPREEPPQEDLGLYTLDLSDLKNQPGTHGGAIVTCVGGNPHEIQATGNPDEDLALVGVMAIAFAAALVGLETTDPKIVARIISHLRACGLPEAGAEELAPRLAGALLTCGHDCETTHTRLPTEMKAILCAVYNPMAVHKPSIFSDPNGDRLHHVNRRYNLEASQFTQVGYVLKKGGLTSINLIRKMILSPIGRSIIPRHHGFIEDSERLFNALNQLVLDVEKFITPPFEPYILMARLFLPRESLANLSIDRYPNLSALTDTLMKRVGEAGHLSTMTAYVGFDRARGAALVTSDEINWFYNQALGGLTSEERQRAVLQTLNKFDGIVDDET